MSDRDFHGRSLLAVYAHPDDESIASGGLLTLCSRRGARVALLCLTRGEHGPSAGDGEVAALARTRTRELEEAARLLGLADVVVRDLPDGMLPWVGDGVLDAEISAAIARVRPDVVLTFDEDGLYWHPDHVAVHGAVTAVVRAGQASDGPALYYVTMPPGQIQAVTDTLAARRPADKYTPFFGVEHAEAFGDSAPPPTLIVDVGDSAAVKLSALRCHRSQVGGSLDVLTDDDARRLFAIEHYRRAPLDSSREAFIEALAATPR